MYLYLYYYFWYRISCTISSELHSNSFELHSNSSDFPQVSAFMVHFHSLSIRFRLMSFLLNLISFNLELSFNLTTRSCHSISCQLDRRSISSQIPISISFVGRRLRTLNVRIQVTQTSYVVLCNSYRILFTSYSPFYSYCFNHI